MKVVIIKKHHAYQLGEVDVPAERANYLLKIGTAVLHVPVKPKTKKK